VGPVAGRLQDVIRCPLTQFRPLAHALLTRGRHPLAQNDTRRHGTTLEQGSMPGRSNLRIRCPKGRGGSTPPPAYSRMRHTGSTAAQRVRESERRPSKPLDAGRASLRWTDRLKALAHRDAACRLGTYRDAPPDHVANVATIARDD
jgi:hypothetical protein